MTTEQASKIPPEPIHARLDREAQRLADDPKITESFVAGVEHASMIAYRAKGRIDAHNEALLAEARDEALRLRAFIAERLPAGLATLRHRMDCGMPIAVDFDSLAEDAREVLAAQAAAVYELSTGGHLVAMTGDAPSIGANGRPHTIREMIVVRCDEHGTPSGDGAPLATTAYDHATALLQAGFRVVDPGVDRALVVAALVACYPSDIGNLTVSDLMVRLGVRAVAEYIGIDLDAELAGQDHATDRDVTVEQIAVDSSIQSAMETLSDRLLEKRDSLRQSDSTRLAGCRLGLEEAARMARSFFTHTPDEANGAQS